MSNFVLPEVIKENDLKPLSLPRALTIPACYYTDPNVFAWERQVVFDQGWQLVGEGASLAKPGDFRVESVAGVDVILVRGKDEKLRAFYNVCRHRAGPVAAGSGNCKVLRCRYHGWVYSLDGKLHTAPEIGDIEGFEPEKIGLETLQVRQVGPLVFVSRSADAVIGTQTIDQVFSQIEARVGELDFSGMQFHKRAQYDIACNWKVYVDNYLEGYHLPHVHPELTKILDYREYSTETFDGYSLQFSEIEAPTEAYGAGQAFYYFIFPNIMLNILPGRMQTNVVLPVAPDKCRVIFDYYYDDVDSAAGKAKIKEDLQFGDLVQVQDVDICQQVQLGLSSGVYDQGRMSVKREQGVHHFQEILKAAYRSHL